MKEYESEASRQTEEKPPCSFDGFDPPQSPHHHHPTDVRAQSSSSSSSSTQASAPAGHKRNLQQAQQQQQQQQQACLDLPESTAAFAKAIHDDAETKSFPKFIATNPKTGNNNWEFPPLDHSLLKEAFGGRHVVYFLGDSTIYYTLQNMQILSETAPLAMVNALPQHNLTHGYNKVIDHLKAKNLLSRQDQTSSEMFLMNRTRQLENNNNNKQKQQGVLLWRGFRGINQQMECEFDNLIWDDIYHHQPEILVANWGLHMFYRDGRLQPCNVHQWFNYEAMLERTVQVAKESNVKLLLFKTTNRVCSNVWYDNQASQQQQQCQATLHQWIQTGELSANTTSADVQRFCSQALMHERSARNLNQRMISKVQEFQQRTDLQGTMKIGLYNDHDLMTCQYTAPQDGLHYHTLQWPRIRLLAHMVNCLLPQ